MSLEFAALVAHAPSLCHETKAPDYQQDLIKGLKILRDRIEQAEADVVVLMSTHFAATWKHYVDATPRHTGILTAMECPDLISDVPYDFAGDGDLARSLVSAGQQAGIAACEVNDPSYVWDYGTLVPLRYLIPRQNIAVVNLSVCLSSPLEETCRWGGEIGKVLRQSGKRAVFVSSGALSHNLVRGRENMPSLSERAMDDQFLDYLKNGHYTEAREMLNQYARIAGVESGGRHLAALLGVLKGSQPAELWGEGQSSGSWNAILSFAY